MVTFRDVATSAVGGPYGIPRKDSIPAIVEMAEQPDAPGLNERSRFGDLVVLAPGTRVLVTGLHQEMTGPPPTVASAPTVGPAVRQNARVQSAGLAEVPRPIGPPMAIVKVLEGRAKDRLLYVPLAYLAPPPKGQPADATKGDAAEAGKGDANQGPTPAKSRKGQ
jgi:hypothetical protein